MKKDIGIAQAAFPMPVLMIATYDENGKVDVMNAAWGSISARDKIALFIGERHKTTQNIRKTKAFTVSLATEKTMVEADYFGIASGNDMDDKFERSGFTARKSEKVNAPVIEEFPLVMECELDGIIDNDVMHAVVGKIVNVACDEEALDAEGKVDPLKLDAIAFDNFKAGYYSMGEYVGQAFEVGKKFMD